MLIERYDLSDLYSVLMGAVVGTIMVGVLFARYVDYPVTVGVPIVGVGVRYTKWLAAVVNVWSYRQSVLEGYNKAGRRREPYGDSMFQIPTLRRMEVFICDRQMTREYQNVDDSRLSLKAVMAEEFQFRYLLAGFHGARMLPLVVIARAMNWQKRRADKPDDPFFEAFSAEFVTSFEEEIQRLAQGCHSRSTASSFLPGTGPDAASRQGWLAVPCFPFALKLISRLTTYSLFGESLCRNEEFLDLSRRFGDTVPRDATVLLAVPSWARSSLAKFLAAPRLLKKLQEILRAETKKRRDCCEKNPMKDVLDFTMDWVDNHRDAVYNDEHIVEMMINLIFAAVHSSSQACSPPLLVHTIFELATRPDYVVSLGEEVRQCFDEHGQGTKLALDSMHKMDSFIKETQRCNPLDATASLGRLALKEFTFSNGLHIPQGTFIYTPNSPIYSDERYYPNPKSFDGLRFYRMRSDPELKYTCDLTVTGEYSMHFGHGRHACPGRFMVSDEVKLAMVRLLLHFEFCIENFGPRPKNFVFGKFIMPDMTAKVWLRESARGN
uniref:p450 monooxygenase n=1 Tax=Aciculosporium take TaxID=42363 RepID=J7FID6_9HYPO|nr:P450 monooxygenase [Aciculosporium take]